MPDQPASKRHSVVAIVFGALASFFAFGLLFAGAIALLPLVALACLGFGYAAGRAAARSVSATLLAVGLPMLPLAALLIPAAWRSSGWSGALVWAAVPAGALLACWAGYLLGAARRRS